MPKAQQRAVAPFCFEQGPWYDPIRDRTPIARMERSTTESLRRSECYGFFTNDTQDSPYRSHLTDVDRKNAIMTLAEGNTYELARNGTTDTPRHQLHNIICLILFIAVFEIALTSIIVPIIYYVYLYLAKYYIHILLKFDFNDKFTPGMGTTYQVQRATFDKVLADQAQEQGVDIFYQHELIDINLKFYLI